MATFWNPSLCASDETTRTRLEHTKKSFKIQTGINFARLMWDDLGEINDDFFFQTDLLYYSGPERYMHVPLTEETE